MAVEDKDDSIDIDIHPFRFLFFSDIFLKFKMDDDDDESSIGIIWIELFCWFVSKEGDV